MLASRLPSLHVDLNALRVCGAVGLVQCIGKGQRQRVLALRSSMGSRTS
jgi:hypothetical protein